VPILQKPFQQEDLERALRAALQVRDTPSNESLPRT
jgi:hypothetical protein